MTKIGIDLRCLPTDGSAGSGVAHAARAITAELVAALGEGVVCYAPTGASISLPKHVIATIDGIRRKDLLKGIAVRPCDLLFVPSGAVSPGLPVPAVPWVHDVDIFSYPEWFPQSWWKRQLTTRLFLNGIKRAPHVFAVSEYTRNALIKLVPAIHDRITVTGEGGDPELAAISSDRLPAMKQEARSRLASRDVTRRFALMLGTVEPRKNIPLIGQIWPDVAKQVPGVDLVIAGKDGWGVETIQSALNACQFASGSLDTHLIRLPDIDDAARRDLLLAAELVLVPSWSEGFGLVALEAMQAGTPVLASHRGALSEVVGVGPPSPRLRGAVAWLLDPENSGAWRDAVTRLLTDETARGEIIQGQTGQKNQFSWKKSAGIILDIFQKIT